MLKAHLQNVSVIRFSNFKHLFFNNEHLITGKSNKINFEKRSWDFVNENKVNYSAHGSLFS